ncbi:hypothetical protein N9R21_03440 [Polaribacter sp.]|nr:hypothetical protein [Polaribacter sp.]
MKQIFMFLAAVLLTVSTYGQVGIGTTNPDASAALEITSSTKGVLIPRMTEAQRDAIPSVATGLMIYQTDGTVGFYYYNGSSWTNVGITGAQASAITANTAKVGYTDALVSANEDVVANTAKVGITEAQASAITTNTAKVGITSAEASAIVQNTAKVGITESQASAITANTAKVGITTSQASAITANTAKVGITTSQASAITANTAKVGITTAQASEITANTAKIGVTTYAIGDSYGSGIVFYVYDGGRHGLIAATADQGRDIRWYGGSNTNTRAKANGIGAGLKNTTLIIANQGSVDGNDFAATLCNEYSVTVDGVTYGDWYLPSRNELALLVRQPDVVGGFDGDAYWSSVENNTNTAWRVYPTSGSQIASSKSGLFNVRAIRAF